MLVDSQAEISLVKLNSLRTDQLIKTSDWTDLTGITDGSIRSYGSTSLELFLSKNFSINHPFQVINKHFPITFDGIIGKDFIWHYKCTICALNNRFTVRVKNNEFIFPFWRDVDESQRRNVNIISVQPRHELVTKVNLCLREDSVVKPKRIKSGLFVSGSIISKQNCFVRVMNTTTTAQFFDVNEIELEPLANFDVVKVNENASQNKNSKPTQTVLNCRVADSSINNESLKIGYAPTSIKSKLTNLCTKYRDVFLARGQIINK